MLLVSYFNSGGDAKFRDRPEDKFSRTLIDVSAGHQA